MWMIILTRQFNVFFLLKFENLNSLLLVTCCSKIVSSILYFIFKDPFLVSDFTFLKRNTDTFMLKFSLGPIIDACQIW